MNKHILLVGVLVVLLFASTNVEAAKRAKMHLHSAKRKGDSAAIAITSDRPFIVGSNIYMLYIGTRHFDQSKEDASDPNKPRLVFYIPVSEYNKLKKGSSMYLTYGNVYEDDIKEEAMKDICRQNPARCWSLGKSGKRTL
jgi:hypothetical protein